MIPLMKEIILDIVNKNQGIKSVDLALKVMDKVNPTKFDTEQYYRALQDLVSKREIQEIEYVLPNMTYRLKSLFFPIGTQFHVKS